MVLTSRRIIWIERAAAEAPAAANAPRAAAIPVGGVQNWQRRNQLGFTGTKVRVELVCWVDTGNQVVESECV